MSCLYCGALIGILFDLFRLLHLPFRSRLPHALLDGLFYACAGAMAALGLLYINGGVPRAYALFGVLLGALCWQAGLSRCLRDILRRHQTKK